jgi:ubiquinone/menaquinone biosynthesis C-methylase UbiE
MARHKCTNVLEIGCGRGELRELPGYLGLDFSLAILRRSGLQDFLYADITHRIPLPDKVFDAVLSRYVLLHIPFDKIELAVKEMSRVAKKCVILYETWSSSQEQVGTYCYKHDLPKLFNEYFDGVVVFVQKERSKEAITTRCNRDRRACVAN